jgi:repressor LexA
VTTPRLPKLRPPTARQLDVLAEIVRFTAANGHAPTVRELGDALGISTKDGVTRLLLALEGHGLLAREPGVPRGIRVVAPKATRGAA